MELGRAPGAISLAAVIGAVEGSSEPKNCVLGLGLCSEENPCALHEDWLPLRTAIHSFLEETTLADLVNVMEGRSENPDLRFVEHRREVAEAGKTLERKRGDEV